MDNFARYDAVVNLKGWCDVLPDYSNRTLTYFQLDFKPQIGKTDKIWAAADAPFEKWKVTNFGIANSQIWFRDVPNKIFAALTMGRLFIMSLDAWEPSPDQAAAIQCCVDLLVVGTLKRLGFRRSAFIPLKMSHAEMRSLAFGSYFNSEEALEESFGKLHDLSWQLYGVRNGQKFTLGFYPQTATDSVNTFMAIPNLENLPENRLLDSQIREFRDRLNEDVLFVDLDVYEVDPPKDGIFRFLDAAKANAEHLIDVGVNRLRGRAR